ncbi:MAG: hypothetical protein ACXWTP_00640, partial [Methylosarcina sp.]
TGQGNQVGFLDAIQQAGVDPFARLGHQGRFQPLLDKALPSEHSHSIPRRSSDPSVVGRQKKPRMGEFSRLSLAVVDKAF